MGTTSAPSGGGRSNPSAQASCDNVCDLPLPTAAQAVSAGGAVGGPVGDFPLGTSARRA
jgi:hypothetical protein